MKKTLPLLILLFVISNAFACSCVSRDFMQRFQNAKFVARAKIISIENDKNDSRYSIAKIQVLELFKGLKITSIKLSKSGCEIFMNKNTVWLIFASENRGKYLSVNGCSGCWQIEKISAKPSETDLIISKLINRQLQMLRYLKEHKIQNNNPEKLEFSYSNNCFKSFKGYSLKKNFAIYEVEISENLSVKNITPITIFENKELSLKIMSCMRKNLRVFNFEGNKTIKKPVKLLYAFYYFPAENGKNSSVSISDMGIY